MEDIDTRTSAAEGTVTPTLDGKSNAARNSHRTEGCRAVAKLAEQLRRAVLIYQGGEMTAEIGSD
jgi:hypothetical protein